MSLGESSRKEGAAPSCALFLKPQSAHLIQYLEDEWCLFLVCITLLTVLWPLGEQ